MTDEAVAAFQKLCPPNEFRVLAPVDLPGPLPSGLTSKFDSVVLIGSGLSTGDGICYVLNAHRVDQKDQAIDQMPFGFVCAAGHANTSGCLVQHGNWSERTTYPPTEFWTYLNNSGLGNLYPITELPAAKSGQIADLKVQSHFDAFQVVISKLERDFSGVRFDMGRETPIVVRDYDAGTPLLPPPQISQSGDSSDPKSPERSAPCSTQPSRSLEVDPRPPDKVR